MNNLPAKYVPLIVVTSLVLFSSCMVLAVCYTLFVQNAPQPDLMPEIAGYFVSLVNVVLIANLGVCLGISIKVDAFWGDTNPVGYIQWAAAIFYVGVLIVVYIFWSLTEPRFTSEATEVVSAIPEIGKSGAAVAAALLAAALGVKTYASLTSIQKGKPAAKHELKANCAPAGAPDA